MSSEIIVALITGSLALIGTVLSGRNTVSKVTQTVVQNLSTSQAVTDTKIAELTREVREHNNFAKRVPILEEQMGHVCDDIRELQGLHKRE